MFKIQTDTNIRVYQTISPLYNRKSQDVINSLNEWIIHWVNTWTTIYVLWTFSDKNIFIYYNT